METHKLRHGETFIDSHCHLHMKAFDKDRTWVIQNAKAAGVSKIVNIGIDIQSSKEGLAIAENYDNVYTTAGIHPHEAKTLDTSTLDKLRDLAESPYVAAIGEIGLDYFYMHSLQSVQQEAFRKQLALAGELFLPVVIHSRDAEEDTLSILKEAPKDLKGVLHCYTGSMKMAEHALAMGFFLSFSGIVTFESADAIREIVKIVPDDKLLIETDAPYLTPHPERGKRNEPAFLIRTAEVISKLRGISLTDLARITSGNTKKFFNIEAVSQEAKITYPIRDSLYLNITGRCTNTCWFCTRFQSDTVKGHYLKLDNEPDRETIIKSIGNPGDYKEIVFCGLGEPLLRLDVVKDVAKWVKQHGGRVRINTNGQGNLIYGRNILPELQGLVDSVSISLDAENEDKYNAICCPSLPGAYKAVLDFIRDAPKYIHDVEASVVTTPGVDIERCREIAENFNVRLRLRKLDVVG